MYFSSPEPVTWFSFPLLATPVSSTHCFMSISLMWSLPPPPATPYRLWGQSTQ
jgi:hypothetical protein